MTADQENIILKQIAESLEDDKSLSLKLFVQSQLSITLSLSDQKKLVKKLVKQTPCVSAISKGEIIVSKNNLQAEADGSSNKGYLIVIIALAIATLAGYYLMHVFLPRL